MALTVHRRKVKRKRSALNHRVSGITILAVGATFLVARPRLRPLAIRMILEGAEIYRRTTQIIATLDHPFAYRHMYQYGRRNIDSFGEDLFHDKFRFPKAAIIQHLNFFVRFANFPALVEVDYSVLRNGALRRKCYTFPIDELYLIYLRYSAVPIRQLEVAVEFGRTPPEVSRGFGWFQRRLSEVSRAYLQNEVQPWFDHGEARRCADALERKGCRLPRCLGFVDGVNRRIANPSVPWLQTQTYSGYKKHCGLNYAGCSLPNGMELLFLGPSPGRRHDAAVAAEHELYEKLERLASFPNHGFRGVFNADSAYPVFWPIVPLYGNPITNAQVAWNQNMSKFRVSIEWSFGQQVQQFSSLEWNIRMKVLASPVVEAHLNAAFLTNLLNICLPNLTSQYYNCKPPSLEKYLNVPAGSLY